MSLACSFADYLLTANPPLCPTGLVDSVRLGWWRMQVESLEPGMPGFGRRTLRQREQTRNELIVGS
jgi:hypothetical protein